MKPESEHIAHFILRVKERLELDCTIEDYYEILSNISKSIKIYDINCSNQIRQVIFRNVTMWVIYGKKSKGIIPARLKTALKPYELFIVPDVLSRQYTTHTFTLKINSTLLYCFTKTLNLDLKDKKTFFINNDKNPLKHIILTAKILKLSKGENCEKLKLRIYSTIIYYLIKYKDIPQEF